ncbi:Bug family tripartite tricarboxylate transporter substrate binding protein [Pollutimonas bauzanensis]|uniref:Tripartite-type tricarboxylate transporter, receptor component TctC n=1 Tax=Pollutimonas bauzanensis TaxID=658167 RepID=A0A1M5ST53_9BURK|nr:tripartite tricarboxylate transporter substrate binding protein [Pollutimonas bauzanensis]SHH41468.1 Tripartite-type tricarboxylate transporter, receptor component TctC [Pollutimonas bauzanensis]
MRKLLTGLAGAVALVASFTAPAAESWPPANKAIQVIVPGPGGGGTGDTIARLIAEQLSQKLKGNFIVENHAGANGNIGAGIAAEAPNDGSKLLFSWAGTLAVSPSLYKKLPFDPQKSFDAIGLIAEVPNILVVNNDLPVHNMAEFTDYVKKHPGVVNFGSTGNGSSMHLAGELYMGETSTNMVHVPYSAPSQATTNLISGEIQSMFQLIPGIVGQVKADKVRALGVMARERSSALPDVPTMAEQGYPQLLSSTWFALLAPKGTPADVIERGNKALNDILQDPEVKQKLAGMGASTLGGTPQDLDDLLASELKKWNKVVTDANIQVQ